jgi:methoxymalonate biosynthesis acyl carrier protein
MNREEIQETLTAFIRERFEIEEDDDEFTPDVHLFDYGYVDSLGAVTLIGFVEEKWGIQITNKDLMMHPMNTVNEITSFITEKVAA